MGVNPKATNSMDKLEIWSSQTPKSKVGNIQQNKSKELKVN
jgi:hypothetical protein